MKNLKSIIPIILVLLAELAIGITLLIFPTQFTQGILITFGIVLIVVALFLIIKFIILKKKQEEASIIPVIIAVVALAVGIFASCFSWFIMSTLAKFVMITYGIIMIISGILKLNFYVDAKREGYIFSTFVIISSIFTIVFGIVICVLAFLLSGVSVAKILAITAGIGLIVEAAFDIFTLVKTFIEHKKA